MNKDTIALKERIEQYVDKWYPNDTVAKRAFKDGLQDLIAHHTAEVERESVERFAQRCLNHSERYYDGDGESAQVVRCGQINHELNKFRSKTTTEE